MGNYRLEFSKGPEVRFISHLELMRAFERSMRRAELPLAFSEGFNPHPKMAFASALAVGVTSDKEYLDLELKQDLDVEEVMSRLNQNLPPGLKIKRCVVLHKKEKALMTMVAFASYHVKVKLLSSMGQAEIERSIANILQKTSLVIEKKGKKGPERKELRPGIIDLECTGAKDGWVEFTFTVQAGSEGNIRPEEVLKALKEIANLPLDTELAVIHRTGLFKKGENNFEALIEPKE